MNIPQSKRTVKHNQMLTVLKHLRTHESITALEAVELYGIMRLSAIIYILRHTYGVDIRMQFEHLVNRDGNPVRFGRYYLGKDVF